MELIKKGKDINLLALTDMEIMTLANILNQYKMLVNANEFTMRKSVADKIVKLIEEKL